MHNKYIQRLHMFHKNVRNFILLFFLSSAAICASEINKKFKEIRMPDLQELADLIQKKGIICMYPINAALPKSQRINLLVNVPHGMRALQNPQGTFVEFIPVTDKDEYKWSQIITLHTLIGQQIPAEKVIQSIKNGIQKDAQSVTVLVSSNQLRSTHSEATIALSYVHNSRRQVMFARYYSGPFDCSGFQYTAVVGANESEATVLKKLKDFAEKNTSLLNF